jgi:hypothetical protein
MSLVLMAVVAAWIFVRVFRRRPASSSKDDRSLSVVAEGASCSFCHKSRDDVARLLHGADASICDECVSTCERILAEGREEEFTAPPAEPELPVN